MNGSIQSMKLRSTDFVLIEVFGFIVKVDSENNNFTYLKSLTKLLAR